VSYVLSLFFPHEGDPPSRARYFITGILAVPISSMLTFDGPSFSVPLRRSTVSPFRLHSSSADEELLLLRTTIRFAPIDFHWLLIQKIPPSFLLGVIESNTSPAPDEKLSFPASLSSSFFAEKCQLRDISPLKEHPPPHRIPVEGESPPISFFFPD